MRQQNQHFDAFLDHILHLLELEIIVSVGVAWRSPRPLIALPAPQRSPDPSANVLLSSLLWKNRFWVCWRPGRAKVVR